MGKLKKKGEREKREYSGKIKFNVCMHLMIFFFFFYVQYLKGCVTDIITS